MHVIAKGIAVAAMLSYLGFALGAQTAPDLERKRIEQRRLLLQAIEKDDDKAIVKLLEGDSADLLDVNDDLGRGNTYLHVASGRCRAKSILALISKGGKLNPDRDGATPSALWVAADACASEPPQIAAAALEALLSAGADPNTFRRIERTGGLEPESFTFAQKCNGLAEAMPSYLTILEALISAGLRVDLAANPEAGGVTLLHWWPSNSRTPLCQEAVLLSIRSASGPAFSILDTKQRPPVDFTLGPSVYSDAMKAYNIFCFTYQEKRNEKGMTQVLNTLRRAYMAKSVERPDVNRACATGQPDRARPIVKQGTDSSGKAFLVQEVWLDRISDPATTHNPDCASPPGGWSRCQLLRLESVPGAFSISSSPNVQSWFKEDDGTCPNSFDPAIHRSLASAGYRRCEGECAIVMRLQRSIYGASASGDYHPYVEWLAKNWSHNLSRCYAISATLGPAT